MYYYHKKYKVLIHTITTYAGAGAASNSKLDCLKYIFDLVYDTTIKGQISTIGSVIAARNGSFVCLKYLIYILRETKTAGYKRDNNEWYICNNATLYEHLDVLKYAYEKGCEWRGLDYQQKINNNQPINDNKTYYKAYTKDIDKYLIESLHKRRMMIWRKHVRIIIIVLFLQKITVKKLYGVDRKGRLNDIQEYDNDFNK
jgi:hypothetical protein